MPCALAWCTVPLSMLQIDEACHELNEDSVLQKMVKEGCDAAERPGAYQEDKVQVGPGSSESVWQRPVVAMRWCGRVLW